MERHFCLGLQAPSHSVSTGRSPGRRATHGWSLLPNTDAIGTQMSVWAGKRNPAGITPTTVRGVPSRRRSRPIKFGSPPNVFFQRRSLISMTFGAFVSSSAAVRSRPIIGCTPSNAKRFAVVKVVLSVSVIPPGDSRLPFQRRLKKAISEKLRFCFCQSMKSR